MRLNRAPLLIFAVTFALAAQDVRPKDVREITDIGTLASLDLLIQATHDNDPEVQMRAVDGLVNFYLPGYVRTGIAASITRVGGSIKGRFTDTNDQVVD